MALKYESGEVPLSGQNRLSTYEAVFIPLRPKGEMSFQNVAPQIQADTDHCGVVIAGVF
jgi:hypothetical protein